MPLGSGKKYKKCCLSKDRRARRSARAPAPLHDIDERLVEEMMRFGAHRFGDAWRRAAEDFDDPEAAVQLFAPWAVYQFAVEGKPIVEWFVEAQKRRLSNGELAWLQAQQASWLSVWEVIAAEPGHSMTLEDLLTGEERTVEEVSASKTLVKRDAILVRVVDFDGLSVLCGVHPRILPPADAAKVLRRIRKRLRRKRAIPVDRLRDDKTGRYLIACWEDAVVGRADISAGILRLESNSVARADSLRERIEAACGDLIRHRTREHSDPTFGTRQGQERIDAGEAPVEIPPADANRLLREFKEKHYAEWADHPMPALLGKTPRQAVKNKAGRDQVDLLLKDCENHEARIPEEQRFDFSRLRRQLGLET